MSSRALAWAWATDLKSGPKFLLVAMADRADDHGYLFPGIRFLSSKTGMSKTAVLTNIQYLCDMDLLKRRHRKRPDGSNSSNEYNLNIPDQFAISQKQFEANLKENSGQDFTGSSSESLGSGSESPPGNTESGRHNTPNYTPNKTSKEGEYTEANTSKGKKKAVKGNEGVEPSVEAREVVQLLCDATSRIPNTVPQPLKTLEKWARELEVWRESGGFGWDVVKMTVERITEPGAWWSDKILTVPKLMEHWNKFQGQLNNDGGKSRNGNEPRSAPAFARAFAAAEKKLREDYERSLREEAE